MPLVVVGTGWLIRNELARRGALAAAAGSHGARGRGATVAEPLVAEPVATEPVPAAEVPV